MSVSSIQDTLEKIDFVKFNRRGLMSRLKKNLADCHTSLRFKKYGQSRDWKNHTDQLVKRLNFILQDHRYYDNKSIYLFLVRVEDIKNIITISSKQIQIIELDRADIEQKIKSIQENVFKFINLIINDIITISNNPIQYMEALEQEQNKKIDISNTLVQKD